MVHTIYMLYSLWCVSIISFEAWHLLPPKILVSQVSPSVCPSLLWYVVLSIDPHILEDYIIRLYLGGSHLSFTPTYLHPVYMFTEYMVRGSTYSCILWYLLPIHLYLSIYIYTHISRVYLHMEAQMVGWTFTGQGDG